MLATMMIFPAENDEFSSGIEEILNTAIAENRSTVRSAAALAAGLMAVVLLCKMVSGHEKSLPLRATSMVGSVGITAACAVSLRAMIGLGTETISKITDCSLLMLPALASAEVSSGAPGTAGALYSGTVFFSNLLLVLISRVLVPLVYLFIGLATANAALGNQLLSSMRDFLSWLITGCLKTVLYVYLGYLTLTGVISGSADAASVKMAKAALSNTVPVVGSVISDASESVVAGAAMLKSSLGVSGMLAVLGICAAPFLKIAIHYLILKITKAVSGTVGEENHVALIGDLSSAMGFLLGMTGTCALIALLSTVCFMKAVGA